MALWNGLDYRHTLKKHLIENTVLHLLGTCILYLFFVKLFMQICNLFFYRNNTDVLWDFCDCFFVCFGYEKKPFAVIIFITVTCGGIHGRS